MFRRIHILTLTTLALSSGLIMPVRAEPNDLVSRLVDACQRQSLIPAFSANSERSPSIDTAYHLQSMSIRECFAGRAPGGFKAGLTSSAAQQRFSATAPVAGVLAKSGLRYLSATDPRVSAEAREFLDQYDRGFLELELAFFLKSAVSEPVQSDKAMAALITAVSPAIELPDLRFAPDSALTVTDIIAGNVAAYRVLIAPQQAFGGQRWDALKVSLQHNGVLIGEAKAGAVMEGQLGALRWLVNRSIANGWTVPAGVPLLTGAILPMQKLQAGVYIADFEGAGKIALTVED